MPNLILCTARFYPVSLIVTDSKSYSQKYASGKFQKGDLSSIEKVNSPDEIKSMIHTRCYLPDGSLLTFGVEIKQFACVIVLYMCSVYFYKKPDKKSSAFYQVSVEQIALLYAV